MSQRVDRSSARGLSDPVAVLLQMCSAMYVGECNNEYHNMPKLLDVHQNGQLVRAFMRRYAAEVISTS